MLPAFSRHGHRVLGRARRIRRGDHLRLEYSGRNQDAAPGAVHGPAGARRRARSGTAGLTFVALGLAACCCRNCSRGGCAASWAADAGGVRFAPPRPVRAGRRIRDADTGVVALFGRSGCGKSTAINIIAGLLRRSQAASSWTMTCCSTPNRGSTCRPSGAQSATSFRTPDCSRIFRSPPTCATPCAGRARPLRDPRHRGRPARSRAADGQAHAPALRRRAATSRNRARPVEPAPAAAPGRALAALDEARRGRCCPTSSRCATSCACRWCTSLTTSPRSAPRHPHRPDGGRRVTAQGKVAT